jgi:hypothetical protein
MIRHKKFFGLFLYHRHRMISQGGCSALFICLLSRRMHSEVLPIVKTPKVEN